MVRNAPPSAIKAGASDDGADADRMNAEALRLDGRRVLADRPHREAGARPGGFCVPGLQDHALRCQAQNAVRTVARAPSREFSIAAPITGEARRYPASPVLPSIGAIARGHAVSWLRAVDETLAVACGAVEARPRTVSRYRTTVPISSPNYDTTRVDGCSVDHPSTNYDRSGIDVLDSPDCRDGVAVTVGGVPISRIAVGVSRRRN